MTRLEPAVARATVPTVPPPRLAFAVSRAASTAVVTLHGQLDEDGGRELAPVLQRVIGDRRNTVVVVDLHDLSGVEPEATHLFPLASSWARHEGVSLRFHQPPAALARRLVTSPWSSDGFDTAS